MKRLLPFFVLILAIIRADATQVIFTEVMYHPPGTRPEYIEISNITSNRFDFASWTLSGGVDYRFPDFQTGVPSAHILKEYERIIVSSANEATTRAAWPSIPATVRVYGPWTGSLNNSGDEITLRDAASAVQCNLDYQQNKPWPAAADGTGHSLQLINPNRAVDDWRNWRASRYQGGSPGSAEPVLAEEPVTSAEKLDRAVVDFSSSWKFWRDAADPDGASPEGTWRGVAFNDGAWQGPGPGFLGHDPNKPLLQAALGTSFATNFQAAPVTYYFRTTFQWDGPAAGQSFALDQWVDDGVIYYLNGVELKGPDLGRIRMASGMATHETLATGVPTGGDAILENNVLSGTLDGQLVTGINVLSAEVHQNSTLGDDIYFGARFRIISPPTAGVMINEVKPSSVAGGGFVEFFNPGAAPVDLNGYYLSDTDANLTKFRVSTTLVVPPGGVVAVGYAESQLSAAKIPLQVILTQPDGFTRQSGFQWASALDGRSVGRRPSGGGEWVLFAQPTPGALNLTLPAPTLALSEVAFAASGKMEWVEVYNTGTANQALDGYFVSSVADLSNPIPLTGTLAPGGYASVAVDFATDGSGEVVLYLSDALRNVVGTAELQRRANLPSIQTWPAGGGEWYATPVATRDAPNNPVRQTAVVINEIMAKTPGDHDDGEFIELYNSSATAVDLSGWAFTEGIEWNFAAGTSMGPGQYLVLAKNPGYIAANYSGAGQVVGGYSGSLRNSGEELRLVDAVGNLADLVDYNSGGQWPTGAGGEGSSLELLHPAMDNSQPSAWRASNESNKSTFQSYTHSGIYRELRGVSPGASTSRELLLNMGGDGYVILRNIKLSKSTAPAVNMLAKGDATSHTGNGNAGFLCTGTHSESDTKADGFHLISQGSGDTKANKAEADITGLLPNDNLTLSFEGRWVYGLPVMIAQTWDRSFGRVFRFPIPGNLGTPGAVNSRVLTAEAPTVDHMRHSPSVPTSSQPVVVTARVAASAGLGAVELVQRQDTVAGTAAWITQAMNDAGQEGDLRAGDGIWSATVAPRANAAITQFYIKATAATGQLNECPRDGSKRPGMWIVANTPPSTVPGLLIQRSIISLHHRNALTPSVGYSSAYDWDHPRMSNYGFNSTFIFNESDILYNCELRRGGSPWTRSSTNTLDRTRWKPPGDALFRGRAKAGVDNDATGVSRFHNRMVRYLMYLFGHPVPENEFIVQVVNGDAPRLGDEMEQTDSDFFDRAYENGSEGELFEIDDAWYMYDTNNMDDRLDAGSVTGRWHVRDWNGQPAYPSDESPIFYHGNWPIRFPEDRYDYGALSSMIKVAANNHVAVTAATDAVFREKMERVLDIDQTAMYAAVRGYVGDWDNFTLNRGKNGYFYRPPGESRFEFHHWDSDLAFQSTTEAVIGSAGGIGWTNLTGRPWFRQKFNYYLSQLLTRYTRNSPRMAAWLEAMNYQSGVSSSLAPFKTSGYNYATAWFNGREASVVSTITNTNYNRAFTTTAVSGATVQTPVISLAGAASSKVQRVEIPGHPEAIFRWTPTASNLGAWEISNVYLKSGLNALVLQAIAGDGSVSATLDFAVTLAVNGLPVANLTSDPEEGPYTAGQTIRLNASTSFDPDGGALNFTWTFAPMTGVSLTHPFPGTADVRFSVPGSYVLTLQVSDPANGVTTLTRTFTVSSGSGLQDFGTEGPLGPEYTVSNLEYRDNFSPGSWYSLEDLSGKLLIQVLDDVEKPLAGPPPYRHPEILRNLPVNSDFVLETSMHSDTREFGNWSSGLIVVLQEAGVTTRYAFSVVAGTELTVARAGEGGLYVPLNSLVSNERIPLLRVVRMGESLIFQRGTSDGNWTSFHTHPLPAGTTASKGGVFVATSQPTTVRVAFDYLSLSDPTDTTSVLNQLRLTEIQYRPTGNGVEFLELHNTGLQPINLSGVHFAAGQPFAIAGGTTTPYTFGNEVLAPGEYLILTDDPDGFRALYGPGPRLAPAWTSGSLSNNGEEIILLDASGSPIHNFTYGTSAPWPVTANGGGSSMEVINYDGNYSDGTNWRASAVAGGSPGTSGLLPDADGDGVPDSVEALFGTDPNQPGSIPIASLAPGPEGSLTLSWPSVPGVVYQVQSATNLSGWATVQTVTGAGSWSFVPNPAERQRFYRVLASAPRG